MSMASKCRYTLFCDDGGRVRNGFAEVTPDDDVSGYSCVAWRVSRHMTVIVRPRTLQRFKWGGGGRKDLLTYYITQHPSITPQSR